MPSPSPQSGAANASSTTMNNSPADDTQSRSANQRATQRAIRFPIEQTMRFQSEAAQLFVDSIETGSAVQQRGLSLATDLARNYARTLERTTRDAGEFATASADAFQSPAITGGQQAPQQAQQPTAPQQMAPPQTVQYGGQQPPQQVAQPQSQQYGGGTGQPQSEQPQYAGQQPQTGQQQQFAQTQPGQQQQFAQPGQGQAQYGGQQAPPQRQYDPQQSTQSLQQAPPQQRESQSSESFESPIQQ